MANSKVNANATVTDADKLQWTYAAIALKRTAGYKGLHVVYGGFNAGFKAKFGEDARAFTDRMAAAGKLVVIPSRGGAMLYMSGEAPERSSNDTRAASFASEIDAALEEAKRRANKA